MPDLHRNGVWGGNGIIVQVHPGMPDVLAPSSQIAPYGASPSGNGIVSKHITIPDVLAPSSQIAPYGASPSIISDVLAPPSRMLLTVQVHPGMVFNTMKLKHHFPEYIQ